MHAVHLPPRHVWRTGLLALLLAFAMLFAIEALSGVEIPSLGGDASTPAASEAPATQPSEPPAWVVDPLRPVMIDR
jgi:hypothetical protein